MGAVLVRRALLIAFHFPPAAGSSGVLRALKFSHHLPEYGWEPSVLTISPRAYPAADQGQMGEVRPGMNVYRAFGLDTARQLSVFGRYPRVFALPDRWSSWSIGGVLRGLAVIRREKSAVIWSTYPIATAHLIGLALSRITGLPWIADFRDPMFDEVHPYTPVNRRVNAWIEARTVAGCAVATVTAPGTRAMFEKRYPVLPSGRFQLIANGYDEEDFAQAERAVRNRPRERDGPTVLLHSGVLYPLERDPEPFFAALAELLGSGRVTSAQLRIVLRATGHDAQMRAMVSRYGVDSLVEIAPLIGHRQALEEMLSADGLLVFQAANCNHQVPAKLFEYFRARKPVLALTDAAGDTAGLMRAAGMDTIAPLDSREAIARDLARFVDLVRAGGAPLAREEYVASCSRRARAAELAALFDAVHDAPLPGKSS